MIVSQECQKIMDQPFLKAMSLKALLVLMMKASLRQAGGKEIVRKKRILNLNTLDKKTRLCLQMKKKQKQIYC